ncbi:MAG: hypothetical protein MMC33_007333 [Icmadophila ericetorum]|nr:hypothetical protein [Icmadophila ericetorum]
MAAVDLHFKTTLAKQNQPHLLTLHLTFLRRTSVGPVTIKIRDVKLGQRTSNVHISLIQGDCREEVVGYIIQGNVSTESGITLPTKWTLQPPPYPVDLAKVSKDEDANWALVKIMPFAAFRKASTNIHLYLPRKGQQELSLADEWIRFKHGEKFTMQSLGFVVDMFPQIVEQFRDDHNKLVKGTVPYADATVQKKAKNQWARFWYPTLLLNLEIKKVLPPEGVEWLFVRVRTKMIKEGRMDLEIVVIDEGGDVVALSQHVCLIIGAERNMIRGEEGKKLEGKL